MSQHPFAHTKRTLDGMSYFSLAALQDPRVGALRRALPALGW